MIVVSDTTPLSELSKIGKLDLLQAVFGRVIITEQVYTELTTGNHPAVLAVKSALWLEVCSISNNQLIEQLQLETDLDLGECSAIILAEELKADSLNSRPLRWLSEVETNAYGKFLARINLTAVFLQNSMIS